MSDNAPQRMTLEQAVQGLADARQRSPEPAPTAAEPPASPEGHSPEAEPVVGQPQQAENAPELPEAEEGHPDDDPELEATTEDGETDLVEDDEEQSDEDQLYTVKVRGKEQQVTLNELQAGYMQGQDYTLKTEQLAATRKEVEGIKAGYEAGAQQNLAVLQTIRDTLAGNPVPQPDPNLFYTDKAAYEQQKHAFDTWAAQVQHWDAALQQFGQEHAKRTQAEREDLLKREAVAFMKAFDIAEGDMPAFMAKTSNLEKFVKETYPIPPQVVDAAAYHGFYLMAEDARIGREARESANGKGKRRMKPRVQSVSSGKGNVKPRNVSESEKAMQRFEQTAQAYQGNQQGVRRGDVLGEAAAALAARRQGR